MLIFEVFGPSHIKQEVDYDLDDDLIYYINADPDFYRQNYFPLQSAFHRHCNNGKQVSPLAFKKVIIKAYENYKRKFPLPQLEEKLSEDKIKDICEKLHSQEISAFENIKTRAREKK